MGTIRLACLLCDEDGFDGIDAIPPDWQDVDEVQTYEQSTDETVPDGPWWTHLGICPSCRKVRFAPLESESLTE